MEGQRVPMFSIRATQGYDGEGGLKEKAGLGLIDGHYPFCVSFLSPILAGDQQLLFSLALSFASVMCLTYL